MNRVRQQLKNTQHAWRNEATWYLGYCAVSFAFGELLFGIDTGSFGSIQALPAFLNDFAPAVVNGAPVFPTDIKSIMNSVVWPGKFAGTLVFEPLAERVGYKLTTLVSIYICCVIQAIALIVQLTANSWQVFAGGRVIAYFGVGIIENVVPVYLSEIAPATLRGFFAAIMNLVVGSGNLWGSGMGRAYATVTTRVGWQVPVAVQFIPVASMALMVPWCPESPRWYVSKGRKDQALKALDRLRPAHDVDNGVTSAEVEALERAVEEGRQKNDGRWIDLCRGNYPRRVLIGCGVFFLNQCSGNQFINLYGPTFFTSVGLGAASFSYNTAIIGCGIFGAVVVTLFIDVIGRRNALFAGLTTALIGQTIVGGIGVQTSFSQTDVNVIVAFLTFTAIGNKFSVNPLCYVISAEVGGVKMRRKIMAIASANDVIWAFVMSYSIPYLIGTPGANLGARVGFFFAGICAAGLIFSFFMVPELTGRSLEEVDELFDRGIPAWRFATTQTTGVGAEIRRLEMGRWDSNSDKNLQAPATHLEPGDGGDGRPIVDGKAAPNATV